MSTKTTKRPTKKELKQITKLFNFGDYSKIAQKTNFDNSYTWRVLNGQRYNARIVATAKKLVAKRSK